MSKDRKGMKRVYAGPEFFAKKYPANNAAEEDNPMDGVYRGPEPPSLGENPGESANMSPMMAVYRGPQDRPIPTPIMCVYRGPDIPQQFAGIQMPPAGYPAVPSGYDEKVLTACPECGEFLPGKSRFCNMCGTKLEEKQYYCSGCKKPVFVDQPFCSECGRKLVF